MSDPHHCRYLALEGRSRQRRSVIGSHEKRSDRMFLLTTRDALALFPNTRRG